MVNPESNMKFIDIINPSAGKGSSLSHKNDSGLQYITKFAGDAENQVKEMCLSDPNTVFNIHGGDGTVNEVINGIMAAKTNDISKILITPSGTGNDFYRIIPHDRKEMRIDLIKYRITSADNAQEICKYSANMINIGFDCDVVKKTDDMKKLPLVKGSLAYILSIINVLTHKFGKTFKIVMHCADGTDETVEGELLLTAIANGGYCGGGFFAAPAARIDDGLLDILIARKISRRKFIALVGDYHNGTHIDTNTLEPIEKFKNILIYRQCTGITVSGIQQVCVDGQIFDAAKIDVSAEPSALGLIISD